MKQQIQLLARTNRGRLPIVDKDRELVFALAPMPALMTLSEILGDVRPVSDHQLVRYASTWRWPFNGKTKAVSAQATALTFASIS
jgi:hypothetical protein